MKLLILLHCAAARFFPFYFLFLFFFSVKLWTTILLRTRLARKKVFRDSTEIQSGCQTICLSDWARCRRRGGEWREEEGAVAKTASEILTRKQKPKCRKTRENSLKAKVVRVNFLSHSAKSKRKLNKDRSRRRRRRKQRCNHTHLEVEGGNVDSTSGQWQSCLQRPQTVEIKPN